MYENFGFAPPIGSKNNICPILRYELSNQTNLNEGTGKPCAGHDKLMVWPNSFSKIDPFDSCANLGPAPPIGSRNDFRIVYL